MNEIDYQEITNEVESELGFLDILSMACGLDELGIANGSGLLSIDEFIDEKHTTIRIAPMDCEFNIFCEGGAIVLQCDFSKEYKHEYEAVLQLCDSYIEAKKENRDKPWILNLTLVPMPLEGMFVITLMGITYYMGTVIDDNKYRAVLVFDNTLTEVFGTDDIDFEAIKTQIDAEYERKEQEIKEELYEAQLELERLEKYNPFEEEIKEMYSVKTDKDEENTEDTNIKEGDDLYD